MQIITFAVRYLPTTNSQGSRLKVTCSAADRTKVYGFYDCTNDDGSFNSRDASENAVRRYAREVLPEEQPGMIINESTLRQIPQPTSKGDELFIMHVTYRTK